MKPEHLPLLLTREMPFGKFKGRVIADLPAHYLSWFAREGFPKGELGELFGATHYLSTAFAAYIIGAGYDSTPMVEHKADGRKITVMFIMVMLFLLLMAWMLTAVNRMAPV